MILIKIEKTASQIEICNIAVVVNWPFLTFVSSVFAFHTLYYTYRRLYVQGV